MKKITSILSFIILFSLNSFAENSFNKIDSEKEFEKLNKIEKYVDLHPETTLGELQKSNSPLLENIELSSNINGSIDSSDLPGNIPPFWWGFCLSLVGFIIVLLIVDGNKDAAKKALVGCLVSGALSCIVYVGLYVWILGNAAYWTSF